MTELVVSGTQCINYLEKGSEIEAADKEAIYVSFHLRITEMFLIQWVDFEVYVLFLIFSFWREENRIKIATYLPPSTICWEKNAQMSKHSEKSCLFSSGTIISAWGIYMCIV